MKKVVCPACGLVNLEKFVTYPHCAACGAPLSGALDERVPVWKRPLSALLWATVLGVCGAALGIGGLLATRETQPSSEQQLVVYVQIPRRLKVGQRGHLQLGLDSVDESTPIARDLDDLQLRFPRELLRDFEVTAISPEPQSQVQRRNGIYFDFGRVPHDQIVLVTLRARRAGTYHLAFSLYARDFPRLQWSSSVQVGARIAAKGTVKGAANTSAKAPTRQPGRTSALVGRAKPGAISQTGR